jgi:hypothetical protein
MALREFSDGQGRRWRVWDIRPDQLHGATRAEDYLQNMIHGWLAFEPAGGGEKRRLSPIPPNWERAPDEELEEMLERAVRTQPEAPATSNPAFEATAARESFETVPAPTIRTFRYPSGRYWTVNEQIETGSPPHRQRLVLRFTSGARTLETRDWRTCSTIHSRAIQARRTTRATEGAAVTALRLTLDETLSARGTRVARRPRVHARMP